MLLVVIFVRSAPFDGGGFPMPRAEAADPGWTSWRGHDTVLNSIEFYTCPRVLGGGSSWVLCRWKGKNACTLSEESVADQKLHGREAEG